MWKCIRCEKENQDSEEMCTACGHGKTMDYTGHRTLSQISSSVTDNWKSSQNTSEYFIKQGREYLQKMIECLEKTSVDSADDIENMTVAELKDYFKTGGTDAVKENPVLMADNDEQYVLGSYIERKSIQKIKFVKIKRSQLPESAWDVSSDENETIWAWTEDAGRILKIGAESRIYANSDCSSLFSDYTEVKTIEFNDMFDTARVEDMSYMFYGCKNLTELDVTGFDTDWTTDMRGMFGKCKNLTRLDVSRFDTTIVEDMSYMFYGCENLMELDVTGFDTDWTTDMRYMFGKCKNLTRLDVTGFDTDLVRDMSNMFSECKNLTRLDVTGFDTGRVEDMSYMFYGCENLMNLDVTGFNTGCVTNAEHIFDDCKNLTNLDIRGLDIDWGVDIKERSVLMSDDDYGKHVLGSDILRESIHKIEFVKINRNQVTNSAWDVSEDKNGTVWAWTEDAGRTLKIGAENQIYANPDCRGLFKNYTEVNEIEFNNMLDTACVINMEDMFNGCKSLSELDVSGFDTSSVTNMNGMFYVCESLLELNVSEWNTGNVTDMAFMFWGCKNLMELDVSGFDTVHVMDMSGMFSGCKNLTKLNVQDIDTGRVRNMSSMFFGCKNLKDLDVTGFDTTCVTNMKTMFWGCENLVKLDVTKFDTSHVTDMSCMFFGCKNLTELDGNETIKNYLADTSHMFVGCEKLGIQNIKE